MAVRVEIQVDDKGSIKINEFAMKVKQAGNQVDDSAKKMNKAWNMVQGGIGKLHSRITGFATSIPALLGFGGFLAGAGKVVSMAAEEEDAFLRLRTAVELAGGNYKAIVPQIDSYIAGMQRTTRFGDGDLAPSMAQIITLTDRVGAGFEGSAIAADLVAAKLFNMETASHYVGMAMTGNVELLGRYIPELRASSGLIKDNMSATEKWAIAKELLNRKFGGTAESDMDSFNGILTSMKNYIGDVVEKLGSFTNVRLAEKLRSWRDALIEFIDSGKLDEWAEKAADKVEDVVDKLVAFGTWMSEHTGLLQALATGFLVFGAAVETANLAINIGKIVESVKLLNAAAASGFFAKLVGAVGVGGVAAFGASLAMAGSILYAFKETVDDYTEDLNNSKGVKWASYWQTKVLEDETGKITHILNQATNEWQKLNYVDMFQNGQRVWKDMESEIPLQMFDNTTQRWVEFNGDVDKFVADFNSQLEKLGDVPNATDPLKTIVTNTQNSMGKIKDSMNGMDIKTGFEKSSPLIQVSGDARGELRGINEELEGMQDTAGLVNNEIEGGSAFWADFRTQAENAGESIKDNISGELAHAVIQGDNLKETFTNLRDMLEEMVLQFAIKAALNFALPGIGSFLGSLFHRGGLVMHQGGPVPRFHSGGSLMADEVPAILQKGEVVTQRSAVNSETLPVLASINRTGHAPQSANISIGGDSINISGGMDSQTVAQVRSLVAINKQNLAREIEKLVSGRRLNFSAAV
jgi:hypothetical protein